jgi:hypothetical protein
VDLTPEGVGRYRSLSKRVIEVSACCESTFGVRQSFDKEQHEEEQE